MTYASIRSAAEHIARTGKITPHQLAAFTGLDETLTNPQRQGFTDLWRAAGSPAAAAKTPNPLPTPYQSQRDNYRDAWRTCFSSSCAMLAMTVKPGCVAGDPPHGHARETETHRVSGVATFEDPQDFQFAADAVAAFVVTHPAIVVDCRTCAGDCQTVAASRTVRFAMVGMDDPGSDSSGQYRCVFLAHTTLSKARHGVV